MNNTAGVKELIAEAERRGAAQVLRQIRKADLETIPEMVADWPSHTGLDELQRWRRILLAVEHGLLCEKCGAPAHRGEKADRLRALAVVTPESGAP